MRVSRILSERTSAVIQDDAVKDNFPIAYHRGRAPENYDLALYTMT